MLNNKAIIFFLILTACNDNSIENICADPIGSQDKSLKDKSIICFKENFNGCFIINYSPSLKEIRSVIIGGGQAATIVDYGAVNCLGQVNTKPLTGFSSNAPIVIQHGYTVKLADNTYGRFYIDSSSESNGINITWQYTF